MNQQNVDLMTFCRLLVSGWKTLLLFAVLSVSAAVSYAHLTDRIYQSSALLAPVSVKPAPGGLASIAGQFGGLASAAGLSIGTDDAGNRSYAILKSRGFSERFISQEQIMPVIFAEKWDESTDNWRADLPEGEVPTLADAFDVFDLDIRSLSQDNKTGFVSLSIEWTDRHLAERWATAMVESLNDYLREKDIAEAEATIKYLTTELEKTRITELRQGVSRLIGQQIETAAIANARPEYAYKVLDPPVVAEKHKPVRPRPLLLIITAFILSQIFAVVIILLRFHVRTQPA